MLHETLDATSEENNILQALVRLTVVPNPESMNAGLFSPATNQTVAAAISKLVRQKR